jgi:hypothetical protein
MNTITNKAIPVSTRGFMIKANTNKTKAINPVHTYHDGNPSRYKTRIKTLKIKALPGSCGTISSMGKNSIPRA